MDFYARRSLATALCRHFSRRLHPSVSYLLPPVHDRSDKPSTSSSPVPPQTQPAPLPSTLPRPSRSQASSLPFPFALYLAAHRNFSTASSSSVPDIDAAAEVLTDAASSSSVSELLSEEVVAADSSVSVPPAPYAGEVAAVAAESSPVVAALQHPMDLVHSFTGAPPNSSSFACATSKCMDTTKMGENSFDDLADYKTSLEDVWFPFVFENSTHRDGAIYANTRLRREWFGFDITDRNETRLDPMMFSKASKRCSYDQGFCLFHFANHMIQVFSLTLVKCPVSSGPIQLYGYIAVRDRRDYMLNYVFNRSRDDPVFVKQGSLIEMTGPKRAIEMGSPILVEFDMRIKNGEEEDDLQLIDGAMACDDQIPWKPIKHRIPGKCGIVDMSYAYIEHAVEATIEVVILEVQRCFSLSLSSYIYVMEDYEEISLFHGTIDQSHGLRRFVVAVVLGTDMLLKFKVGNDVIRYRTIKAKQHGCDSRRIKLQFASFLVKVTWSTI